MSSLTTLFFVFVMEPLTIGAALAGLLTSAFKTIRLLKSFTTSPDAPESMKVVLDHLVSISSALNRLKPLVHDPSTIVDGQSPVNPQHLVVPLTACVIILSQLECLIDTIRTDPKCSSQLYARLEGISSFDYISSSLPDDDIIWRAENSEAYVESRRSRNGAEKEVIGLAIIDDGLDWMSLADFDDERMTGHGSEVTMSIFNKQKWDEEHAGYMVNILGICQEMLEILADINLGYVYHPAFNPCSTDSNSPSQAESTIPKLSELTSQILNDETLKTTHNIDIFLSQQSNTAARRNIQLASQLYLRGPLPSNSIISPSLTPSSHNILAQLPNPILPSSIANRSWYRFPLPLADPENTTYQITIKSLTGQVIPLKISTWTTCLDLKLEIQNTQGLLLHQQYLFCEPDDRWLPEDVVLSERGVREGSRVHVLLSFWGRGRM